MFTCQEGRFISFDGTELFYRAWTPQGSCENTVMILHRGHEHSGRVAHLVDELKLENTRYFSFDLRGHGLSPGPRGWAPSFDTWVRDLNAFSVYLRRNYGVEMERTFVVANSVGSVMAAQWVHDCDPGVRGMVLAAPAFSIKLYVPFALTMLRAVAAITDRLYVTSYVKSKLLTRDKNEAAAYDRDTLITKKIAISVLVTLFDSAKRLLQDARAIETPTLILSAGSDFIVSNKAQEAFYFGLSSAKKKFIKLAGFKHALFHEKDREQVLEPIREFIHESYAEAEKKSNLPMAFPEPKEFSVQEVQALH
ncbi:MAG: lysophospholipase, partial [Bdellovibrionota bacterium]